MKDYAIRDAKNSGCQSLSVFNNKVFLHILHHFETDAKSKKHCHCYGFTISLSHLILLVRGDNMRGGCAVSQAKTPRWLKEISLLFYTDNNLPTFLRVLLFLYSSGCLCSLPMTLKHFQHIKSERNSSTNINSLIMGLA